MNNKCPIVPIILAGGGGTRLWPLSRGSFPKQFHSLTNEYTLIQNTILRLQEVEDVAPPIIICNEDHRFLVAEQFRKIDIDTSAIMLEPVGRNTAPAICVGAEKALQDYEDPILFVLPSDHLIGKIDIFTEAIQKAVLAAKERKLVTFGIVPDSPHTGYGYVQKGDSAFEGSYDVASFVEKPNKETAEKYLSSGDYFWNSGMFVFKASRYLDELRQYAPDIASFSKKSYENAQVSSDFIRLEEENFRLSPSDSIDYAVMENTKDAVVVPLDAEWNDVGSWSALWDISDKNSDGNAIKGDVIAVNTKNSYISAGSRLIAGVGLENMIIVETGDSILVADREKVQDVKEVVNTLKDKNRIEVVFHRKVYRPWGFYEIIDQGTRYIVKRITVNPGARLSLQMHYHRAEHWIVVKGTAKVECGDQLQLLTENQSTYIPIGEHHRLSNEGKIPLEIIEIQSGSYLDEDDIVRFEDNYNRK